MQNYIFFFFFFLKFFSVRFAIIKEKEEIIHFKVTNMRMKLLTFFILIYLFIFNVSYGKKLMINTNQINGTILISTVDGYIHAIDTLTVNKLWSFGNDDENNLAESYNYNYYKKNNDDNNNLKNHKGN